MENQFPGHCVPTGSCDAELSWPRDVSGNCLQLCTANINIKLTVGFSYSTRKTHKILFIWQGLGTQLLIKSLPGDHVSPLCTIHTGHRYDKPV